MIRLLLGGKPAVIKSGTSVKLTAGNRLYTKSDSYTLEIELPLDLRENLDIFGPVCRLDTPLPTPAPRFDAELYDGARRIMSGTAKITGLTSASVKVQLLSDTGAYNSICKEEDLYIDRLDLGTWYQAGFPDEVAPAQSSGTSLGAPGYSPSKLYQRLCQPYGRYMRRSYTQLWTTLEETALPWVLLPVYNSSAGLMMNPVGVEPFRASGKVVYDLVMRDYPDGQGCPRTVSGRNYYPVIAPMPCLWLLAELVAKATGYTLARQDNALYTDSLYCRIVMAHGSNCPRIALCLPHWSVNDFWTNVENSFGVVLGVDYAAKTMTLKKRTEYYSGISDSDKAVALDEVSDVFTAETSRSESTDISSGNVGFADFETTDLLLLPDWVRKKARTVTTYANLTDVMEHEADTRRKDTLYVCADGRCYIYCESIKHPEDEGAPDPTPDSSGWVEVDMYRPRITDPSRRDTIDTELKFVPATLSWEQAPVHPFHLHGDVDGGSEDVSENAMATFPMLVPRVPGVSTLDRDWADTDVDGLDIEAAIAGEQEDSDTKSEVPDVIYMAVFDSYDRTGGSWAKEINETDTGSVMARVHWPRLYTVPADTGVFFSAAPQIHTDGVTPDGAKRSLALNASPGIDTLADASVGAGVKIDTSCRYCCTFLTRDGRIPDPGAVFLIHSKRWVCEKIETTLGKGVQNPLMTGYFYPLSAL